MILNISLLYWRTWYKSEFIITIACITEVLHLLDFNCNAHYDYHLQNLNLVAQRLINALPGLAMELIEGAAVTISDGAVGIRKLPIRFSDDA